MVSEVEVQERRQPAVGWLKTLLLVPAAKQALIIFVAVRLFLSVWAVIALEVSPLPDDPEQVGSPYLGEPRLTEGISGLLLGPWQRFDTQRYLRIVRQGYTNEADSVFPPLYPLAIRISGRIIGFGPAGNLLIALTLSSLACLITLVLLHKVVAAELGPESATRTLVYLVLFPTGFYLFAAYTESIFLLFALGSVWMARNGRFWIAGVLGFLASLTRLTGWVLVVPLAYEYWRQHIEQESLSESRMSGLRSMSRVFYPNAVALLLPPLGFAAFLVWRWSAGLPSMTDIYSRYWYQTIGIPGKDLVTAVRTMLFGGAAAFNGYTLYVNFGCAILLLVATVLAYRRLGPTYGLYATMLVLFMLLSTSHLKPLYSYSRYALANFPMFMLLGLVGKRPWANRLILYLFLALFLYFSGQFFIWGWVA